jgi:type IV fimbrial biogenesis protein FimT
LVGQLPNHLGDKGGDVLRRAPAPQRGFSLIEVVIAMAIFAILTTLAVPSMTKWIANVRVRSTADALQNGIRLAQSESLRRSRQVVFSLTNSANPSASLTATANGANWSINTVPSMVDGSETSAFVESGTFGGLTTGVAVNGPAAICFNSLGRMVANGTTGITGASCALPTNAAQTASYVVNSPTGDRPLQVNVSLSGQIHMCDSSKTLSSTNPDGC